MLVLKICAISATALSVIVLAWVLARPEPPVTPRATERQATTQAMTGWGAAFANHR